jgi:RND family efflux transporter MFP subunit
VVTVERGTVAATVSATGSVVTTRQAKLVFAASGRLQDVLVNVGDRVTAGQPLAHLAGDSARLKLETANSQLATAQLKLRQLTESASTHDLAAARSAYDAAVAKLDDVQAGPTAADLESAQASLVQAQASYREAVAKLTTLLAGPTDTDRVSAEAAVQSAQNTLASAEAKLDELQAGPTDEDVAVARAGVDQARATVRSAESKLEQVRSGSTQAELAAAQSSFDQAQATLTSARAKLDQVKATQAIPTDVVQAQSTLTAAESKLQSAHQALDQLTAQLAQANANLAAQESALTAAIKTGDQTCDRYGDSSAECASARQKADALQPDLLQARNQIKLLTGSGSWDQLAARKDVLAAQAAYDAAAANLKQTTAASAIGYELIQAQTSYDAAVSSLTSVRAKLDETRAGATNADLIAADSAVQQAEASLRSAQAKLDQTLQGATPADQVTAETAVDTARANLTAARTKLATLGQPTRQDVESGRANVASASAALDSAQTRLAQVQAGPTRTEIQAAQSTVASAQAALADKSGENARLSDIEVQQEAVRQARLAVEQAQVDLDNTTLVAPFDGVVAAVTGNPGETAPTGTSGFITLVDPSAIRVDVTVDETDVTRLAVGKSATITFDALSGQSFRGAVIAVSPSGTLSQGVVTYPVSLSIDAADRVLPAGLTASSTITVEEKNGVLVIPARAVRRQGAQQVVEVLDQQDKTNQRAIRTGLTGDEGVEVLAGLNEGDRVVLASTTTRSPTLRTGVLGQGGTPPRAGP